MIFRLTVEKSVGSLTVQHIKNAYRYTEGIGFIAHGPIGWGKTSWQVKVAAHCLGTADEPDYEAVKKWLIFTPQEFCNLILKVNSQQMILIWDDAGYWLNRLFWYETFVKESLRYMTLQRTQFGGIVFSTPSLTLLPNKILELEHIYRAKIYKLATNSHSPNLRPRLAWVKRPWYSDDLTKRGCTTMWQERFSAFMPDDFFAWYEPRRKEYTLLAAKRVQDAVRKAVDKKQVGKEAMLKNLETEIGKSIPDEETVEELGEAACQYA